MMMDEHSVVIITLLIFKYVFFFNLCSKVVKKGECHYIYIYMFIIMLKYWLIYKYNIFYLFSIFYYQK